MHYCFFFFFFMCDRHDRGSFLEGYKKYCGAGWSMRQKTHVSFKAYVLKIFFIEISKAI